MLVNKKTIRFLAIFAFLQAFVLLFVYQKMSRANADTFSILEISNKSLENFIQQTYTNRGCAMQALEKDVKKLKIERERLQVAHQITKLQHKTEMQIDSLLRVLFKTKKVAYSIDFRNVLTHYYDSLTSVLQANKTASMDTSLQRLKQLRATEADFLQMANNHSVQEQKMFLNSLKADILLANFLIVFYLYKEMPNPTSPNYNYFRPAVILSAKRIEKGENLEAKVYLAASSAQGKPKISVNGKSLELDETGIAFYEEKADKIGIFPVKASITTRTGTGQNKTITGEIKYKVKKACR